MIDDTIYSYLILNIKNNEIIIGDPHNDRMTSLKRLNKNIKINVIKYSINIEEILKIKFFFLYLF